LVTAPSNIAVDNIAEKLVKSKIKMCRLGHPARVMGINK
jgi:superfamily I DNA and/or RNA helicase